MAEILFVGNERVGARVAEVSGKEVEFTGDVTHIADIKDTIISKSYWAVFDLSTFTRRYNVLLRKMNINHYWRTSFSTMVGLQKAILFML